MDDLVKAALKKWPNVPDCRGWLGLDARGNWYMRDDRAQAAGPFPASKGSRIAHDRLRSFIERNYAVDPNGCWFFQNGPQRVYVELEATPWIWRLEAESALDAADASGPSIAFRVTSHTGIPAQFGWCGLDEAGRLFIATELGLGLVHSQDMHIAALAVEAGLWNPEEVEFADLPARFRFQRSPAAAPSVKTPP